MNISVFVPSVLMVKVQFPFFLEKWELIFHVNLVYGKNLHEIFANSVDPDQTDLDLHCLSLSEFVSTNNNLDQVI